MSSGNQLAIFLKNCIDWQKLISFQQIIDFVPAQEQLKKNARLRYSAYKKLGHTLSTQDVKTTSQESTNQTEEK